MKHVKIFENEINKEHELPYYINAYNLTLKTTEKIRDNDPDCDMFEDYVKDSSVADVMEDLVPNVARFRSADCDEFDIQLYSGNVDGIDYFFEIVLFEGTPIYLSGYEL